MVAKRGPSLNESVKRKLITKRKQIKNKLNILKHGQIMHESMFQPITKHLQNIETKLDTTNKKEKTYNQYVKREKMKKEEFSDDLNIDEDINMIIKI